MMNNKLKWIWKICVSGFLFLIFLIFIISINLFGLFGAIPDLEVLENPKSELASEVYSEDGVLLGKYFKYNRTKAEYNELPPVLINALVATEDARFYSHSGVDFKGTFAIFIYAVTFQKRGSSTLSQQLAKNLFQMRKSKEYQGALSRIMPVVKIKEIITAIRLERAYTKKEILTMYLNTVEFGNDTYGIVSASKKYFNKKPSKLTTEEAALLVGLLKGPSLFNPLNSIERAYNRRNTVLGQMVKYGYLKEDEFLKIKINPIKLSLTYENKNTGLAPYFRSYIEKFLDNWADEHGYNLYRDGLKIYTTIDSRMQAYAEAAVEKHMSGLQKEFFRHWKGKTPWQDEKGFVEKFARRTSRYRQLKTEYGKDEKKIFAEMKKPVKMRIFTVSGSKDTTLSPMDSIKHYLHFLHTGFVSMNPQNGHVKAWVGDVNHAYFKYDHVKQGKRQPGSTFKPILYSYAIEERGMNPCTQVLDTKVPFTIDGKVWVAKNSNNQYSEDYYTLRKALAKSINSVSAFIMKQSGPDSIVSFAKRMGISGPLDPVPPLCLGTSDVSVFELVNAYSVFLNNGFRYEPLMITRIEDKYGNVLQEFSTIPVQVISAETAANMIYMLTGSVDDEEGTAKDLRNKFNIPYDIGGKTGTTQGSSDGWFIGISPELVSGVWVGGEERGIKMLGPGAKVAMPIWGYYMQKVFSDRNLNVAKNFNYPEGFQIPDCDAEDNNDDILRKKDKNRTGKDFQ
ncbi:MAG: penicillin-binding protein 1A [Cytophagaceae bacterium]